MTKGIYAIYDTAAESIVGTLMMFPNNTAAIRTFGDVASDPQTMVSRHIQDHQLVKLGTVDDETGRLTPIAGEDMEIVMEGETWAAAQRAAEDNGNLQLAGR